MTHQQWQAANPTLKGNQRDYALPEAIKTKMREFMARYMDADVDVSALGVPLNAADVKQRLAECLGA